MNHDGSRRPLKGLSRKKTPLPLQKLVIFKFFAWQLPIGNPPFVILQRTRYFYI
jgi:hypothetical protein